VGIDMNRPFSPEMETLEELAAAVSLDYVKSLSKYGYIKEKITPLPYAFAAKHHIIALEEEGNTIILAICNPYDLDAIKEARFLLQKDIKEVLTTKDTIQKQIETLYVIDSDHKTIINLDDEILVAEKEYDLLEASSNSSIISLINRILVEAIRRNASDIHFEPTALSLLIKFRIDGILFEQHVLPKSMMSQITTRLKVQAELDIAESRMPQDGRIKLKMGEREIDFRLSTIPVIFGERVVLRISDNSHVLLGLNNLDLKKELLTNIRSDIKKKQGIILVTGPTGSGKTRTLYSALSEIATGDLNIMTIEDPVENKLKSMAQINVNHKRGLTFAKGLRHILRQDPDVIMIGEIRDKETVDIAIEASLTGHLVLSTLHTNDAPSTIIRLIDMGVEPYLISSSLISICSQRLIRKICTHCNNKKEIRDECKECSASGYAGRRGIYEYLNLSPRLKKAITNSVDAMTLKEIAIEEGMKTLYEDGLSYVEEGITTLEEVERVTSTTKGG
jgi:general secretion pathway protein E